MPHAIRIHETGGPEVMRWEEVEVGQPGPGEVRVRNTALGLNFIDTYHRTGLYPMPLPTTLGMEGAGVVEAVGPKVKGFKAGDRVAYANPIGSYAEVCLRPVARLVKIPAEVDDKIAAAIMLKGMTAWYLCKRTFKVGKGQTILVHAAAGGVGQILSQWAKYLGATVIGTVGSEEKAALAKKAGCKHVIVTSKEDFVARVKEITGGKGANVVLDMVGGDYLPRNLQCMADDGRHVSIAVQGGATATLPIFDVMRRRLTLTGSTLRPRDSTFKSLVADELSRSVWPFVAEGRLKPVIDSTFPLSDAAAAHTRMDSGDHIGKIVLTIGG